MHASKRINFKLHDDLGQLDGANVSNSLHANVLRDTTFIPGNAPCSKNVSLSFDSNLPMNEQGFVDECLGGKKIA